MLFPALGANKANRLFRQVVFNNLRRLLRENADRTAEESGGKRRLAEPFFHNKSLSKILRERHAEPFVKRRDKRKDAPLPIRPGKGGMPVLAVAHRQEG